MSAESQQPIPQEQGLWRPDFATRFKPGVSANPGGRPKNRASITVAYDKLMMLSPAEILAFEPQNGAEAAAKVQAVNAISGKPLDALPSVKEITDRTEGKAPQKVEVSAIPASDNERVEAAILRVIQATGCQREIAEQAVLAQPEFQVER